MNESNNDVTVTIHTARPGIVIGRGGQRVEELRKDLERIIKTRQCITAGDTSAGVGRLPGCAKRRRPAGTQDRVPTGHQADARTHDAGGGRGYKDPLLRQARRRRHSQIGEGDGGACSAPYAEGRHRLRTCRGGDGLRTHRSQSVDLQGGHTP
ncbi:30S ribosomal protein S3 [Geodia barretti]|uniref:30S ribosomal protein S3 n=1 Tax=Geodia barretti TaxID=519541 RepID=A0AA35W4N1_GEOBA|nr:30S ribosomal protein S3 [Geodia barretti]